MKTMRDACPLLRAFSTAWRLRGLLRKRTSVRLSVERDAEVPLSDQRVSRLKIFKNADI